MKKNIITYLTFVMVFSLNSFAQQLDFPLDQKKMKKSQIVNDPQLSNSSTRIIKSYRVEEKINLKFGGRITTYDVSDIRLIDTYDLGPDNIRIITPIYADAKNPTDNPIVTIKDAVNPTLKYNELGSKNLSGSNLSPDTLENIDKPKNVNKSAQLDIIKTYEKMVEKGYKTADMLKKIANAYYFNEEFDKAAVYYNELFAMTTSLESEYYYRYSISLKTIGQNTKADEFLKKFNQLSNNITQK